MHHMNRGELINLLRELVQVRGASLNAVQTIIMDQFIDYETRIRALENDLREANDELNSIYYEASMNGIDL